MKAESKLCIYCRADFKPMSDIHNKVFCKNIENSSQLKAEASARGVL